MPTVQATTALPDLTRLSITVSGEEGDLLSAALAMSVPYGWEENTLATGEAQALVHADNTAFLAEVEQAVNAMLPQALFQRCQVPRKDWTLAWRDYFTPVEAGSRFVVLAPWMHDELTAARARGRTAIIIEPKMAFGTGHHATTALCLRAVSDLADAGRIAAGQRFLDLGTGSGILGIACATLGLTGLGLDIDMLAVENSLENAALNQVSTEGDQARFCIRRGSIDAAPGNYDLVLANILAQPLKDMAPDIAARKARGGCLVLSGILGIQAGSVAEAYEQQGLGKPVQVDMGEWSALVWS